MRTCVSAHGTALRIHGTAMLAALRELCSQRGNSTCVCQSAFCALQEKALMQCFTAGTCQGWSRTRLAI